MYDTRWPRPGPAMAAVAVVLGLVAGAIFGFSSTGSAPQAQANVPVETTVAAPTTTLPEEFHTVVLGSYNERAGADARLRETDVAATLGVDPKTVQRWLSLACRRAGHQREHRPAPRTGGVQLRHPLPPRR